MDKEHPPIAATLEIKVGSLSEGVDWYERLLGRAADFTPTPDLHEWEIFQGFWIQVTEGHSSGNAGRLRLGVLDVEVARRAVIEDLRAQISEVVTVPGIVAYCDFDDPWGNPLGLFQDLAQHPDEG